MKIVFTAIAMALITIGCSHQPAPEINSKPYDPQQPLRSIFRGNLDAVDRGQLLIQAMKQNSPQTNFDLFLGLDVAFVGGAAPPGGNADLLEWHSPEYRIQAM